jgi:hypothetical protein
MNEIENELRQYKLHKIKESESKLNRFEKKYNEINEHVALKMSKNITSNIFRVFLIISSILCFFITVFLLIESSTVEDEIFDFRTSQNKLIIISSIFLITASIIAITISFLLKLNIRKRNNIFSLAKLLDEIILHLEKSTNEDKKNYEHFMDLIAENKINVTEPTRKDTV